MGPRTVHADDCPPFPRRHRQGHFPVTAAPKGVAGYEVTVSFTALCPACGRELGPAHYLTADRPGPRADPFDRDDPYERKDRRVFVKPCECFTFKPTVDALVAADVEYDAARKAWDALAPGGIGEIDNRSEADYERLRAAKDRRDAALHALTGASA
jgi:hypothetical protein